MRRVLVCAVFLVAALLLADGAAAAKCKTGKNGCTKCRASNWCTQCGPGYALGRGECVKCQLRDTDALTRRTCKACKAAAPMYCALCVDSAGKKPMWASTSGSCKYCDDGCAKCDNGYGKCTQCKKGWTWSTVPGEFGTCMQLVTK